MFIITLVCITSVVSVTNVISIYNLLIKKSTPKCLSKPLLKNDLKYIDI